MGIVVAGPTRQAIFAESSGAPILALNEGEAIGSFTLHQIAPDGIELTGPGGPYHLVPTPDATVRPATNLPPPPQSPVDEK